MEQTSRKFFIKGALVLGLGELLSNFKVGAAPSLFKSSAPLPSPARVLRVAHLTDIHMMPDKTARNGFAEALKQVNTLKDKPDFIINGGDSIMNAATLTRSEVRKQWNSFKEILNQENEIPVKSCIGNHDLFGWAIPGIDKQDSKRWAVDELLMPSRYYSFQQNSWKFIVLDSIHSRKSIPGYFGKLDETQFKWLNQELLSTPAGMHVCIISHIPILAVCTFFDKSYINQNHWSVPDNTLHADADRLRDLFYRNGNVKCCLSGHIHLIDHVNYLGSDYYCNGAVSGAWWKGDHKQFSPSFIIMNFFADGSSTREVHHYNWKVSV